MSIPILLQIAVNVVLFLGMWALWAKFRKPPKDDPRLSRGLQLLQSKISVLEDLSDKTDLQVNQIIGLLDKKCRELQNKTNEASAEIQRVNQSIEKSLEVSKIFEDRIPHHEIIERQKTRSYVRAAQLAHSGMSVSEIARQVDIPESEIEMIAKVNKERLMFSEENLPAWVGGEKTTPTNNISFQLQDQSMEEGQSTNYAIPDRDESVVFKPLVQQPQSLSRIGEEFRKACQEADEHNNKNVETPAERVIQQLGNSTVSRLRELSTMVKNKIEVVGSTAPGGNRPVKKMVDSSTVRKLEFPKIDLPTPNG